MKGSAVKLVRVQEAWLLLLLSINNRDMKQISPRCFEVKQITLHRTQMKTTWNVSVTCSHLLADSDDCDPNPCPINSACADRVASFACLCNVGFGGPNCTMALGKYLMFDVDLFFVTCILGLEACITLLKQHKNLKIESCTGKCYQDVCA
jgi:hypothetical protein